MHYQQREAAIYDKVYRGIQADIPYWQTLAQEYCGETGEALELACGTLRVLLPVAATGVRVMGIDESPYMLEIARQKLADASEKVRSRVQLAEGDIRSFDLGRKFDLIYIPFNTFGILTTLPEQLAALETIKQHLAPKGVFAFDVFFPDVERMHGSALERWQLEMDETFEDGSRVQRDNVRQVDTRSQIMTVRWRNKEYQDQQLVREWITDLKLSYFFPRELDNLLARAGYEIVHYWGDLHRNDFWKMSEPWKQLIVAKAKTA